MGFVGGVLFVDTQIVPGMAVSLADEIQGAVVAGNADL